MGDGHRDRLKPSCVGIPYLRHLNHSFDSKYKNKRNSINPVDPANMLSFSFSSFIFITISDFVKSLRRVHCVFVLLCTYLGLHQVLQPVGLMLDVGLLPG